MMWSFIDEEMIRGVLKYLIFIFQSNSFHSWLLIPLWHPVHMLTHLVLSIITFNSNSHFLNIVFALWSVRCQPFVYVRYVGVFGKYHNTNKIFFYFIWAFADHLPFFMIRDVVSYLEVPIQILWWEVKLFLELRKRFEFCSLKELFDCTKTFVGPHFKPVLSHGWWHSISILSTMPLRSIPVPQVFS